MTPAPPEDPPIWRLARADGYEISTAREGIDLERVVWFLQTQSYWARDLAREKIERALAHSLVFGIHAPSGEMAGFARVVSDRAVFAYLRDVFVLEEHRGKGLASWLAREIRRHPELETVTSWLLATRDAHEVYARAGYAPVPHPGYYMRVPPETP